MERIKTNNWFSFSFSTLLNMENVHSSLVFQKTLEITLENFFQTFQPLHFLSGLRWNWTAAAGNWRLFDFDQWLLHFFDQLPHSPLLQQHIVHNCCKRLWHNCDVVYFDCRPENSYRRLYKQLLGDYLIGFQITLSSIPSRESHCLTETEALWKNPWFTFFFNFLPWDGLDDILLLIKGL